MPNLRKRQKTKLSCKLHSWWCPFWSCSLLKTPKNYFQHHDQYFTCYISCLPVLICISRQRKELYLEKMAKNQMDHSKQPTRRTKNFLKNQPDFSRTCGFRGEFTERLNFQIQPSNMTNPELDFCQNRLKVKNRLFWPR